MALLNGTLKEISKVFLKLGFISFGGPAAHIAMMEEEVVERRKWMNQQEFLDLVGATNLIPGPNSTEMTMHCGYVRGGRAGLFIAGISFILPAILITAILAYFFVEFGTRPEIKPFLYGIKPAVIAIIAGAIIKLWKKAMKNNAMIFLGLLVIVGAFSGINEIALILGAGLIGMAFFSKSHLISTFPLLSYIGISNNSSFSHLQLFFIFLKIGSVLFGSGYVLIAYLDAELVENLHWLTHDQILDAVAFGQFTPGPVLSTATFVGYQLAGFSGALLATIGIFLPSFLFVWLSHPFIPRLRKSTLASAFLDAVNAASLAIMMYVTMVLAYEFHTDWRQITIALLGILISVLFKKISAIHLVLGGAIMGYLLYLL